ncbi:type IV secretion system DNA-binding domain-containing protein [Catellatospora sp. NPDC049111]|uniref:type IV secretory system conjugative DNA transfer family protein n=1 Tax=Catellatospora sp. NPDC049111 TaxID=3155271 RepID=UPI0034093CFA
MGWVGTLWRASTSMTGAAVSAGNMMAEGWARRRNAAAVRPGRRAMQTGILAPGDGPPSGTVGTFRDYREVLVPDDVKPLSAGPFPMGRVKHPQDDHGAFPIYLGWEEVRRHLVVVGSAGSGKTTNVLVPLTVGAAEAGLGCVVVDTKGDFLQELVAYRARYGINRRHNVVRWDIADPANSHPWNPLAEVHDQNDAAQVALAFLGEVDPARPHAEFAERDHRWLRGLVYLLVRTRGPQPHPRDLYMLVVNQQALATLARQDPSAAIDVIDLMNFPPADFSKATWALANRLSWLAEPGLATMLDGSAPRAFTLRQAIDSGAIIKVGARVSGGERTMAAAALMLNLLKLRCMENFGSSAGPRMLWILDEAPKYAHRIKLDEVLDFMRGAGVAACVGVQDVTQFGGEVDQERMLANADTLIALRGASAATAAFVAKRLGDVQAATVSNAMDARGAWSPTLSHQAKPMLGVQEIMQPPVGQYGGIIHIRGSSPHPFLVTFD